jgi:hypothetical protein
MARGGAIRVTIQALKRRFDELLIQLDELEGTTFKGPKGAQYVDDELFLGWCVKARNLLSRACGEESEHYRRFLRVEEEHLLMSTNHPRMKRLKAVFLAAKEDYEGGYLRSIRSFVHAELFDDELEQARELLASGYTVAAAIVARVVLETTLRTLCGDCNPVIEARKPNGKSVQLADLNIALAKAGVYTVTVQTQVTSLAAVGNDAAHGNPVKAADVEAVIAQVRRFVTEYPVE